MLKTYDVVIVGAGISGLTSAILAAKHHKKVAVIEAGKTLSPMVTGFVRNNVHFETGFHYASGLGEGEIGSFFFKDLGLEIETEPLESDGYDKIMLPSGQVFNMAYGQERLKESLIKTFPKEEKGIKIYFDKVSDCLAKSSLLNLHKNSKIDISVSTKTQENVKDFLDYCFSSPEIKVILGCSFFLHGTPLDKISFGQHTCIAGGLYQGAYGIKGGGHNIVKAYKKVLEKLDVDIYLNTQVTNIEERDFTKIIKTNNGEEFCAKYCISTIHPKELLKIAPGNIYRNTYKNYINSLEETAGFFTLYAQNTGPFVKTANLFILSSLDLNSFYCVYDEKDKPYHLNFSPAANQAVNITCLAPSQEEFWAKGTPVYEKRKKEYTQLIKEKINKTIPGIANNLKYLEVSTPMSFKRYVGYLGAYGLCQDSNKIPLLPMTKIKGLYLAGQSIIAPGFIGSIITSYIIDKLMESEYV